MMKEYRGQVVHVHRPPAGVIRGLDEAMALPPEAAKVRVRLDNGQTVDLTEPPGERLVQGDRVTLHADLTGGPIGPIQKDNN